MGDSDYKQHHVPRVRGRKSIRPRFAERRPVLAENARSLPERNAHLLVLREAMSVDSADPTGAYFSTSTGQLFCTRDEGGEWGLLADFPPPIYGVEAFGPCA